MKSVTDWRNLLRARSLVFQIQRRLGCTFPAMVRDLLQIRAEIKCFGLFYGDSGRLKRIDRYQRREVLIYKALM